jgi:cytochrome c553
MRTQHRAKTGDAADCVALASQAILLRLRDPPARGDTDTVGAPPLISPRPTHTTPDMTRSTIRIPLLAGGLALLAALPALAQAPAGSAERGKQLTYTCQGCHGVTGYKNAYPAYSVPKITGQSADYLSAALNEYRSGARKHPTMRAQAQSFSEQDIADIAAYLSSLKKN